MNMKKITILNAILLSLVVGCDSSETPSPQITQPAVKTQAKVAVEQKEDLVPIRVKEFQPQIALPFCENKKCIEIEIQSIATGDAWLDQWIAQQSALVIQDQIGLKQQMKLQQAIDAYVRASDESQADKPYQLALYTRIPYQRKQYVLLQLGVDAQQHEQQIKERYYYYVADRETQKTLTLLSVIQPDQQIKMNHHIQTAYQEWLKQQSEELRKLAPAKLYWGQADWFFDHDGLGLHYRNGEIAKNSPSFDLYLNLEQTQQVTKPEIYQIMF
jgi:hypothetical protein